MSKFIKKFSSIVLAGTILFSCFSPALAASYEDAINTVSDTGIIEYLSSYDTNKYDSDADGGVAEIVAFNENKNYRIFWTNI